MSILPKASLNERMERARISGCVPRVSPRFEWTQPPELRRIPWAEPPIDTVKTADIVVFLVCLAAAIAACFV